MIPKQNQNLIKNAVKPYFDSGLIDFDYSTFCKLLKADSLDNLNNSSNSSNSSNNPLLTRAETAKLLKVCTRQVDVLANQGKLTRIKFSERAVRFNKDQVYNLISL
jgi:hypothetical protein